MLRAFWNLLRPLMSSISGEPLARSAQIVRWGYQKGRYLDGVVLKRSWAGEVKNVSVLVAIGVGADGFRQILGVAEGEKEKGREAGSLRE
jgi:transposase-like protein